MKKFIVLMLGAVLCGCCSSVPNFYQPTSISYNEVASNKFRGTVLLNNIFISSEFAKPQIITLGKKDYQVNIDEFNRWASQPEKIFQRVINENLSTLLPNAMIENQSTLRKNFKYSVNVEFLNISGRLDEKASISASYFIKNNKNKIIKYGKFNKDIAIDGRYESYIPAISNLLGELSKIIALDIIK